MAEVRAEVKTYSITYHCSVCGIGEMLPTGIALLSSPPQYPHKCTKCGEEKTFRFKYPRTVYEAA